MVTVYRKLLENRSFTNFLILRNLSTRNDVFPKRKIDADAILAIEAAQEIEIMTKEKIEILTTAKIVGAIHREVGPMKRLRVAVE